MADDPIAPVLPDAARHAAILAQQAAELTQRSAEVTERARQLRELSSMVLERNQARREFGQTLSLSAESSEGR